MKSTCEIHNPSRHRFGLILNAFILALTTPLMMQAQVQPHRVTPWTPRPPLQAQQVPLGPAPSLSTAAWTSIGPSPLAITSPANANFNVSGRIVAIAANPTDANTIYIAAAGGGVWKTTNGGASWTPLTDAQTTLAMGAIAVAPSNPLVIYAGTGEANNAADSNFGRGILLSTDGGTNWTLSTGPGGIFNTNRLTCSKIVLDPTNANIAYAAIAAFGNNGAARAANTTGIYKTTDGGTTWTNVTAANGKESTFDWSDVAVDPNTPSIVYAAVGYIFGTANTGVYKSTDSGATWTLLNAANAPVGSAFGRITIAISKTNNANVLYIAAENNTGSGALARFVRSDDAGVSFNLLSPPNYMGSQGWYDQTLIVDPTNSAIVYAAGSAGTNSILRSATSGASWTDIHTGGLPNNTSPHVDHHGADFDANGKLLDGDDGGIYRLDTPTTPSWSDLNGNLGTIQFTGIGLHPTNASIVIGGSQDNGTELYTGSAVWTETDGGDGGYAKFSSTNGNRVYHQIPNASFGTNFFRRSDDGGSTWVTKTAAISVDVNVQNFYAPFSVDPGNGDRVLYGTNGVWETTNGGDSWTKIGVSGTAGFNSAGTNVDAIGIAPSDANTIYAATGGEFASSSKIFVTTNHGGSWTEHDLPAGAARVSDVQVDPSNAQIAYAVVNRFSANGHVFITTNGGVAWTNISGLGGGALPNLPVWSIQVDGFTGGGQLSKLYIGAEDGVYFSTNLGVSWSRLGTGLTNAEVVQLALNGTLRILGAATHGRGAWEISLGSPTTAPASLSGIVTDANGSPLAGATLNLSGATSVTTFTRSDGSYHFDNLESSQFYTVTPSLANYQFTPVNRSFSLVGDRTDAAFTGTADAVPTANAVDTTGYFVRQHYLDFLGREPDQGGFEYWVGQINQCNGDANCVRNKRIDVSASFFASPEFQQTGSFIYELYAGALGRTPNYTEFMPDRSQVIGGPNLEAARVAFADAFVQRPEFIARYPLTLTRDQFVDELLQSITTRSGTDVSALRDQMLSDYDAGGRSLAVRDAVQANAFVQAEYNKAFVLFEYFAYLRRNPDTGGYDFWLDVLNGREAGNYRGMVCAFLTSTEYQQRFSSVVTHSNAECGR